ncbi:hypothetical protein C4N9_06140 [Pararhodobacter marinus]|uniref:HTH tetR-type domain-containing protein n=1 Tax=Pararhodobacter marinus TaxID=2184063 RepID=A0A2U2CEL2_9RHOB|nr:TetR/AcrR family transcriptional regulator [Pararhodobacter marinus]PWE30269.1 hypothetical protein C4N9_06140 [Pararhodobacter marinus]
MPSSSPNSPRARFLELGEPERALWLDPAEAEFVAHGFERASLNRIIASAGESKGRTYHYFSGKGALFDATLERRLEPLAGLMFTPEALADIDPAGFWKALATLSARLTERFQQDATLAALVRTLHREKAAQEAVSDKLAGFRARIEGVLAAGRSVGAVRDDLPLSMLADVALDVLISVDRWFARHADSLPDGDEAALSQRAFSLLMTPLLPQSKNEGPLS